MPVVGRSSLMATQDSIYLGKGGTEGGREGEQEIPLEGQDVELLWEALDQSFLCIN